MTTQIPTLLSKFQDILPAQIRPHAKWITLSVVAVVAGASQNFLQQIEAGRKKEIWLSTVERFAKAFSLEVHEFLAPQCPGNSKLSRKTVSSRVHKGKAKA